MATPKKKLSTVKSTKSAKQTVTRSSELPFFTFRITQQSVYWLILCLLILGLGIWVIALSVKVQKIYDQIDRSHITSSIAQP